MIDLAILAGSGVETLPVEPAPMIGSLSDEALVVAAYRVAMEWIDRHYDHLEEERVTDIVDTAEDVS